MNVLTVTGIGKQKDGKTLLQEISFTQNKLEKIAIAGETGSGKSTLLKIIAGLLQADAGEVIFAGNKVLGPEEKLLPGHKHIAYLSQHFELRNNYRVEEELDYTNQLSTKEAETIFSVCQISHLLKRKTDQLSGGEKQRISTARLLIAKPQLLLLDEPFSNLDTPHKNTMKAVIEDICTTLEITCLLVSHDPLDTLSWADKILVLQGGKLLQTGTPEAVYRQPVDEYSASLLGSYTLLNPASFTAFFKRTDWEDIQSPVLLRPEQFILSRTDKGVKGIVEKVMFFGGYVEVIVRISNTRVQARSTSIDQYAKGDTVFVALVDGDFWVLGVQSGEVKK